MPFFKICDECLPCLLEFKNWMIDPQKIPENFPVTDNTKSGTWNAVFNQLYTDGFIKEALFDKEGTKYFILSTEGRIFIKKGGYIHFFAEKSVMLELDLQESNSVISTNNSVRITNKIQVGSIIITGIAIVVGAVFQVRSWYVSSEQLRISESQYKLDSMNHKTDSLSLEGIKSKVNDIQKKIDAIKK